VLAVLAAAAGLALGAADAPADGPSIASVQPRDHAVGILRDAAVVAAVQFAVPGDGIDTTTLTSSNVLLVEKDTGIPIPANLNSDAAGGTISLQPTSPLASDTKYEFEVTAGLKTESGQSFAPFSSSFTTGEQGGPCGSDDAPCPVQFDRTQVAQAKPSILYYTSLAIGPDHKLYAATINGAIARFAIQPDGTLGPEQDIHSLTAYHSQGPRTVLGLAFDPSSTASNLILWVTNSAPGALHGNDAPDWSGKVTRMAGPDLANVQDYVTGLPRSIADHMTNSLAFGPGGALYVAQGANTAAGAPDKIWGFRPERELSAAILRIKPSFVARPPSDPGLPLSVKTADGGSYDPFAPNAPLTIYADGLRNPFDLVWASNGHLYAPVNGTAKGGTIPATPTSLPAICSHRIDGAWTGPATPGETDVAAEDDWIDKVMPGKYYGHPDPARCEWAMNGGNPTAGKDFAQVGAYPVGVEPDRNYAAVADPGAIYDLGQHYSPDGVLEYRSNFFGGALKHWLLIARYSAGDDVIALRPSGARGDIPTTPDGIRTGIPGLTGLDNPLDVVEDPGTGNVYVSELPDYPQTGIIDLERPVGARVSLTPNQVVQNAVVGTTAALPEIVVRNTGTRNLKLRSLALSGKGKARFAATSQHALPLTLAPGQTDTIHVSYTPAAPGPQGVLLHVRTSDPLTPDAVAAVRGLGTSGLTGVNEPSLQWILDTYQVPDNVGDPDPSNPAMPGTSSLIGDEVAAQRFVKAGPGPVSIVPMAVFGPKDPASGTTVVVGHYTSGDASSFTPLFTVPASGYQTLNPPVDAPPAPPLVSFDPGSAAFGFASQWPHYGGRMVYQEDALNTWDVPVHQHKERIYPLKNADGSIVPNAYVVASEESTIGFDYNDVVLLVLNATPSS
jgi:hypothetical protein